LNKPPKEGNKYFCKRLQLEENFSKKNSSQRKIERRKKHSRLSLSRPNSKAKPERNIIVNGQLLSPQ
jgi:hypothetical protein